MPGLGPETELPDRWRLLDDYVRRSWDMDVVPAEASGHATPDGIPLPHGYVAGATEGSPHWYTTMFDWDGYFINLALLVHGRSELVRPHIENYLYLIDRFGYMPNGNQVGLSTRSQVPVFVDSILRYIELTDDGDLLRRAYPRLVHEYRDYWLADHHATPTGLVTNRDLGDPSLDPRLAAEAETGLDFTTQFDGDVTQTNPVITNASLVLYARVLERLALRLGLPVEADTWRNDADSRAALVRRYCWSEERGLFLDYNYVTGSHVSVAGASAYWALWTGIATAAQAARSTAALPTLLFAHGLAATEPSLPDDERFTLSYEDLQWSHPAGWPPLSIIAAWGLDRYGHHAEAASIARRTVACILNNAGDHHALFEKYNVVDGSTVLPNSRYGTIPLHGWTSAAVVLLGRRAHEGTELDGQLEKAMMASVGRRSI